MLNKYKKISEEFNRFDNNYMEKLEEIKNKITYIKAKTS